jgi:uncharacterized protein YndB with AHSA1/START domain
MANSNNKEKFEIEFLIRSTPSILFEHLSTPSGLAKWFCDDVNVKDGIYIFEWDEERERAKLVGKKSGEYIRFKWLSDEEDEPYFEWRIRIDAMTNDLALLVTDFAYPDDKDAATDLWESQIHDLMRLLGS